MSHTSYDDQKYCSTCDAYVNYLASIEQSYCVQCGGVVKLLSSADWQRFEAALADRKPKGGRPKKSARKQTA